jgi:hypothetical protein
LTPKNSAKVYIDAQYTSHVLVGLAQKKCVFSPEPGIIAWIGKMRIRIHNQAVIQNHLVFSVKDLAINQRREYLKNPVAQRTTRILPYQCELPGHPWIASIEKRYVSTVTLPANPQMPLNF